MSSLKLANHRERGIALLVVVWAVGLLSVIVLALGAAARLKLMTQSNLRSAAQAESIADGVVTLLAQRIALYGGISRSGATIPVAGGVVQCEVGEHTVRFSVIPTTGLVDINAASVELLRRLLSGIGLDEARSARLADAIVAFRSSDGEQASGRFGRDAYIAAGLKHGPKHAPFATVGELDQVLGMSADLLDRLLPLVTVLSGQPTVSADAAPERLRIALSAGKGEADRTEPWLSTGAVPATAFQLQAWVRQAGGTAFARSVTIELTPSRPAAFQWRDWRRDRAPASAFETPIASRVECIGELL